MPENFQMQQQKNENVVQAIPLFPYSPNFQYWLLFLY